MECLFCDIINKKQKADLVYEDENFIVLDLKENMLNDFKVIVVHLLKFFQS